jgi:hypothetical protein
MIKLKFLVLIFALFVLTSAHQCCDESSEEDSREDCRPCRSYRSRSNSRLNYHYYRYAPSSSQHNWNTMPSMWNQWSPSMWPYYNHNVRTIPIPMPALPAPSIPAIPTPPRPLPMPINHLANQLLRSFIF